MANLKRDKDGLTEMQRRFVEAYIGQAFLNATKAAKLAGYSERTAYSIGHELTCKRHVRVAIVRLVNERFRKVTFNTQKWPLGHHWRTTWLSRVT